MDKTTTGQDNLYYELEPPKKESEAGIYEDVAVETAIPATKPTSYEENTRGAKKKNKRSTQNASQSDGTVLIRRLVFISTAVVAVAFLTAAATLILALSLIMSRNDRNDNSSAKDLKDCGAIYGKYSHKLFFTACSGQKRCKLLKLHNMSIISPKSKSRTGQK